MERPPSASTDLPPEPAEELGPKVGDVLAAYRLVRLLGQGATGRVFEVEHTKIGRRAALKVLNGEHANRPGAVRRLFQEAQAVNRIKHPNIVDVTDVIEGGPLGVNAIVMELLEGESLAQTMLRQAPLPAMRVLAIMRQVADALSAAHGAYFVHRDLKPENIFLVDRGGDLVKLLDFGLAKIVDGPLQAPQEPQALGRGSYHTVEGTFVGTPAYTSPEQASAKRVDHRTDLYSFGVILYELLGGRLPFEGRNFGEFVVKHLTMPVPAIAADRLRGPLERQLAAIAYKCLEKQPEDRFSSAGDVSELLDAMASGKSVTIPAAKGVNHAPPRMSRRVQAAIGAGVLLAVAVAVFAVMGKAPPVRQPPAAITIGFQSTPEGALVRRLGQPAVLGKTPFRQSLANKAADLQFEFSLQGFLSQRVDAALGRDQSLKVQLAPNPAQPPQAPVERQAPTKRSGRSLAGPARTTPTAAKTVRTATTAGPRTLTVDPFAPLSR